MPDDSNDQDFVTFLDLGIPNQALILANVILGG